MFPRIGMPELIIILVVALIIFGPGKLPEAGKALGRTIKEFRKSSRDLVDEAQEAIQDAEEVKAADSGKKPEPTNKA
ncbi:twin-arginine translocase TatA/TatE family subunit [Desulforudis sp. 1088]|uniref:twin-arginine translocase TatA/TatE family subunit n=1 Tax=unclassified Candidatus Desulforudis TaxID=2635950 RepID=UPI003CE46407